jgi:hypothetical protein
MGYRRNVTPDPATIPGGMGGGGYLDNLLQILTGTPGTRYKQDGRITPDKTLHWAQVITHLQGDQAGP